MKRIIRVIAIGLILVISACNMPIEEPTGVPSEEPAMSTPTEIMSVNTPAAATEPMVENTADASLPAAQPEQTSVVEFTEKEACKLISADEASQFLGETVAPQSVNSPEYSFCTYFTPAGKSLLLSITFGDQVKKNFLNEIGQYQKGCKVSYSGGTSAPTPFPPEIEAMMSKPVLELFNMDMEFQKKCGGNVESVPEFGPNAYILPNLFGTGSIAIISGENYYTFTYGGQNMEMSQMIDKTKEIVRSAMVR